jgi:hypothetical protein
LTRGRLERAQQIRRRRSASTAGPSKPAAGAVICCAKFNVSIGLPSVIRFPQRWSLRGVPNASGQNLTTRDTSRYIAYEQDAI